MSVEFATNPFGKTKNETSLPNYGTPVTAISSVLFNNVDSIFAYKSFSQPDLLHQDLKRWSEKSGDESRAKTFFQELDVRSGAGLTPLGFSHGLKNTVAIVAPGFALPYFINSLQNVPHAGKFLLNVGALNYDNTTGSVTNDYVTALDAASKLKYGVVTPISTKEVQSVALLALAIASFSNSSGAINLFDGLNYAKTIVPLVESAPESSILAKLSKVIAPGAAFDDVLDKFNELTGLRLHNFQYFGAQDAETVFVTYGSLESELFNSVISGNDAKIGLINIRVPLPFNVAKFVTHVPSTTKKIVVIGQTLDGSSPSFLRSQVSAALFYHGRTSINVSEYIYQPNFIWSPNAVKSIVSSFIPSFAFDSNLVYGEGFIYWASDKSINIDVASRLVKTLSLEDEKYVSLRTKFDNFANAGTFQAQFVTSEEQTITSNIDSTKLAIVESAGLLKHLDVTATVVEQGAIVLVSQKPTKDLDLNSVESYVKHLEIPQSFLISIAKKGIKLFIIDAESINDESKLSLFIQAVFWKLAFKLDVAEATNRIWKGIDSNADISAASISEFLTLAFKDSIKEVPSEAYINFSEIIIEKKDGEEELTALPIFVNETSFVPNQSTVEEIPLPQASGISNIAKKLSFQEAYEVENQLRPDLPVKNFVVKVKENRRVTPDDYDRYIFHIEFDISGTGMTYDIGEALGIHARNNEALVKKFLQSYGLNEFDIVLVPNKDNHHFLETRTVLQAFVENLDVFGRPPKRFYESLIPYATNEEEKKKLEDLVTPAGAVDLKRFQDVEYYTYADIFEAFPSVRPSLEELVTIIEPLKRREYSIASSQRVHPNEVHLLIVVVDWIDNKGRKRYGQASKYISDLAIGSELVVSVKPSVMKLPPSPKQPVIMSGLGTGLAPFKAIVEEKLWQKQQGYEIGEVFLYLGSRHKREEYLYGELWEAYKDAGIITHIGAAFSRDQPQKIYIQDRIKENLDELKTAIIDNEGSFYLCGPTWPVPDITQALQDILAKDAKERGVKVDLDAAIEELKEASRYILEVY
ncbi:AIS_HP2_G0016460.mRNA.1.CDS.1 [Saccharomyces cerevisiae]|nr:AIS_HP2_G0016460.mRNA.1.CDS.1 [Saccharomyces cerevisiae]CAI6490565.1 AIS_HP2_G0016460.mRNA.1.CDS.1 [Saccharomyces cerevisiae]